MKRICYFFLLFTFLTLVAYAQRTQADIITTKKGELKIQPILHSSMVLEWRDELIFVDPYGGAKAYLGLKDPTVILITDIHGDHLNIKTLESLNTDQAIFVVPDAVKQKLPEGIGQKVISIGNGDLVEVSGIAVTAIPMYNLPETEDSRHPKGRGNGYIVNIGGKRLYISGDTEDIQEMRDLENIDIAFVCMNLPYTMDIDQAASAVINFAPSMVYPFHYRGKGGLADISSFAKQVISANENIEVRLRDWYPDYSK